jgi:hypothetical protein
MELALDRKEWKLVILVSESWSSVPSFLLSFVKVFSLLFALSWFDSLLHFLPFYLVFYHPSFSSFFGLVLSLFFAHVILSIAYTKLLETTRLDYYCCYARWLFEHPLYVRKTKLLQVSLCKNFTLMISTIWLSNSWLGCSSFYMAVK